MLNFNSKINLLIIFITIFFVTIISCNVSLAENIDEFVLEEPILITCTGQTPGSQTVYAMTRKLDIIATHENFALPKDLEGYKTMIVVMAASLKGMGAAGVNQDEELERCHMVFKEAKEKGIKILGMHVAGESRRNKIADRFIEPFAPLCDYLLVLEASNKDNLFTNIANENDIKLTVASDIKGILTKLQQFYIDD